MSISKASDVITLHTENRRSFRVLEQLKSKLDSEGCIVISDVSSLGLNDADIANQLDWFIIKTQKLVICSFETTYEFGVEQPMNSAILKTILQTIINNNHNVIQFEGNRRSNSGRHKVPFPDNWEELYKKWEDKEISSQEFLSQTGLKRATFYNLITEYRERMAEIDEYEKRFRLS